MSLHQLILKTLNLKNSESTAAFSLLAMGFFMGIFLATLGVGASTLFLNTFDETTDLPFAILISGVFGILVTAIFNFLQSRFSFKALTIGSITSIILILTLIEIGFRSTEDPSQYYFLAFTFIAPATFIVLLVFWGTFGRMFDLRQSKRIIGGIDTGQLLASILALFSIPFMLKFISTQELLFVSLVSAFGYLLVFFFIVQKGLLMPSNKDTMKRVKYSHIIKNKYVGLMALFVIVAVLAANFVNYSFLNVTTLKFTEEQLPTFLSLFEGTIVVFSFLFQTFVTDKIIATYGLKVSLLINPILIIIFTSLSIPVGYFLGFSILDEAFIFFFILVSMSKLLISSLQEALDGPAFKLYFLPVDSQYRFDVQTKIEGVVTAFAGLIAGGLIMLINNVKVFSLIHISIFTLPLLVLWYFITKKMHVNYRKTLQQTLTSNKVDDRVRNGEYMLNTVLSNEINSPNEEQVLYGLMLMEKLEPALFESSIIRLAKSARGKIQNYAIDKLNTLDIASKRKPTEVQKLAQKAAVGTEDLDILSVAPDNYARLSKSKNAKDRMLVAKLLRNTISESNIFMLLELLRDVDPQVKMEALITSRRIKRPETWSILIELLDSPTFSSAATAALSESGEKVLDKLEAAFHKSGQSDQVMLRIVQIMGRIGTKKAMELLWKKIENPDKAIVKQILLSIRHYNYQADQKYVLSLTNLLDNEIGKMIWNIAALTEIPENNDAFKHLQSALKEEIKGNNDMIFMILSILYDPQSIQLVRENIESDTKDGVAFAIELLDLFLLPDLKSKLFPLIDDISVEEKMRLLQSHYHRESYTLEQVLVYILARNYNQLNRWTKACAIHCLHSQPEIGITSSLIAQLFNEDLLLQETAAWVIYHKDSSVYNNISDRLPADRKRLFEHSIKRFHLNNELVQSQFLHIELVHFLKSIPEFKKIKGVLLCDIADHIKTIKINLNKPFTLNPKIDEDQIFITAQGEVTFKENEAVLAECKPGEVFGKIFDLHNYQTPTILESTGAAIVLALSTHEFFNVMANHHELARGFIKSKNKSINLVNTISE
ncbi:MAG: hypothetical protein ACFCUU_06545 [Cyclobacteriaceae bacterium]